MHRGPFVAGSPSAGVHPCCPVCAAQVQLHADAVEPTVPLDQLPKDLCDKWVATAANSALDSG